MKLLRCAWFIFAIPVMALLAHAAPSSPPKHDGFRLADLLPNSLNPNPRIGVSVITELTPEGRAVPAPDANDPTYYAGWDGGMVEVGDTIAGEVPPNRERLAEVMRRAFVASGYLPATAEHPPTVVIHYRWGSYNKLTPLSDDPANETDVRKNVFVRASIVGGADFAQELLRSADSGTVQFFRLRDSRNDELTDMAMDNLYFIVAVGFDAAAAHQGKKVRLWTTKISASSEGLAMDETLPTLASSGRLLFGHETKGAVLTNPRLFAGRVEVGEPVVVEGPGARPAAPPAAKK